MKVCIFQGFEDDDNLEILATFTDRDGNVHVDTQPSTIPCAVTSVGRGGVRMNGHDGIAFSTPSAPTSRPPHHPGAGEVVPHNLNEVEVGSGKWKRRP
ncbi:MAG: hypothetical protein U0841_27740 [Chloroflexia bacterium]